MVRLRSTYWQILSGLFPRLFLAGAGLWALSLAASVAQDLLPEGKHGVILEVRGPIGPAIADYVVTELDKANADGAALVLIEMDTPGGLDTSMRTIIQGILSSEAPVATYVAPSGARAASAGLYILVASHVAAMAPGTNTGAATPIALGGSPPSLPSPEEEENEAKKDKDVDEASDEDGASDEGSQDEAKKTAPALGNEEALRAKVINDASAYIRSLAEMRGRNVVWVEKAVRAAESLAAGEALEMNVIDIVASDTADLVAQMDGREVTLASGALLRLETKGIVLERIPPGWLTRFLAFISSPNVAFILMSLGTTGIIIEMWNPGAIFPGTLGVVSLIIALYSFQVLPVNWAGAALIGIGIVLVIAEAWTPTMGVLGFFGLVLFVIGSLLMFPSDTPGFVLSKSVVFSVAGFLAVFLGAILVAVAETRHRGVMVGTEAMEGRPCVVETWQGGQGRVMMDGEIWAARSDVERSPGDKVEIIGVDGLVLIV